MRRIRDQIERRIREPRLIVGGIYKSEDLIFNMRISKKTLAGWVRSGLKPLSGGTKAFYFLTDDAIKFLREQNRS